MIQWFKTSADILNSSLSLHNKTHILHNLWTDILSGDFTLHNYGKYTHMQETRILPQMICIL